MSIKKVKIHLTLWQILWSGTSFKYFGSARALYCDASFLFYFDIHLSSDFDKIFGGGCGLERNSQFPIHSMIRKYM